VLGATGTCEQEWGVPSREASLCTWLARLWLARLLLARRRPAFHHDQPSQPPNEKKRPDAGCEGYVRARVGCTSSRGVPSYPASPIVASPIVVSSVVASQATPCLYQPSQPPNEKKRPDVGCEGYVRARVGRTSSRGVPSYLASLARLWLARLWLARLWLARLWLARFGLARLLLARRRP
jgi:hypothetical protein